MAEFEGAELQRVKLPDLVRQHLTMKILDGTLAPGDPLPSEGELARSFKVSKAVVREAMRELNALSVLDTQQGRPSSVRGLTSEPLAFLFQVGAVHEQGYRDLIELRRAIECEAAGQAAERRTPEQLEQLRLCVEGLADNIPRPKIAREFDWLFHLTIVQASENRLLVCVFEALKAQTLAAQELLRSHRTQAEHELGVERHRVVYEAIRDRDPVEARLRMSVHFNVNPADLARIAAKMRRNRK
ncbi:MAG: FadR family transcriptional regulator [Chelatococcus sp.]|jgi:GntR family transcriptional repressor for pyruvate dehydrogenase complex|uniref:FadR/GntR family transcriptional regulator n=1 Tax=Chelatococcus sp. TaxID=1953771 RepID=UPI0025BE6635|nr:FadR/GntR family transcriptional regulator [Chelatococcus sp.]MBX3538556.1 FadR family transcriptional regulator [Chelatococcus sp.]